MSKKDNKISKRLAEHLRHMQKIFGGNVSGRNNSFSAHDGRFEYIRKFFVNEDSYIGLRIKKDDIYDHGEISFYALKKIGDKKNGYQCAYYEANENPIIEKSRSISYDELLEVMRKVLNSYSVDGIIKELNVFFDENVDLNVLKLSRAETRNKLAVFKTEKGFLQKQIVELLLVLESEKEKICSEILQEKKTIEDLLMSDPEYQSLLKQREELERKIEDKRQSLTNVEKKENTFQSDSEIFTYFNDELKNNKNSDILKEKYNIHKTLKYLYDIGRLQKLPGMSECKYLFENDEKFYERKLFMLE